jgi:predicted DNA-binding protein with PD1-like motif
MTLCGNWFVSSIRGGSEMKIRSRFQPLALAAAVAIALPLHAQTVPAAGHGPTTADLPGSASSTSGSAAPGMKVQVLNRSSQETTYAVIFSKGDEVIAGLTAFAQKHHIGAARITGIGGIEDATVEYFDRKKNEFRPIPVDRQSEVLSLLGDIASYQGKPVVHLHIVLGFPDGSAHGGHLLKAHVWPTMEVIVTKYPNTMPKKLDTKSGLTLIDPSAKQ